MLENLVLVGCESQDRRRFREALSGARKVVSIEDPAAWSSFLDHFEPESSLLLIKLDGDYPGLLEAVWSLKVRGKAPAWAAWLVASSVVPIGLCWRMGAAAVFAEPFRNRDLLSFLEDAFAARVPCPPCSACFDIVDLLHFAWQLGAKLSISVHAGDHRSGVVKLEDGRFLDAVLWHGPERGPAALAEIMRWTDAQLITERLRRTGDDPGGLDLGALLPELCKALPIPEAAARSPALVSTTNSESPMSTLDQICQSVVDDVGDALACGVVDLNTGIPMGVYHDVPYFTQAYIDAVSAAAVDMFRGKNVRRVEKLLSRQRGKTIKDSFSEIFINSSEVFHFMKVIKEKQSVVVLVTHKTTNQGMGWAALRNAINDIQAALP